LAVPSSTRITKLAPLVAVAACTTPPSEPTASRAVVSPESAAPTVSARAPQAIAAPKTSDVPAFPHDVTSFTEGLLYDGGALFESTGLYGQSRLKKVDLASGRVLAQVRLADTYFGEGLALLRGELYQLTYKEGRCFVYDAATLEKTRELSYSGEGWGLTTDGALLIQSDGSPTLTFRDPKSFAAVRTITVTGPEGPVVNVNELEWVDGFILANVWETNVIIRIDPATGKVVQAIDLAYLPEPRRGATEDDVLNGIAWDAAGKRLFVTGKRWSHVFQIPKPW
jgi:glutaminyl-peptide cyclotransferase